MNNRHCLIRTLFTGLLSIILISFALTVYAAGIRYAKPAATGTGDCSNWADACTLQTALTGATAGDEIWVAAGVHKPTTGNTRAETFQLKSGVAVYGGFAATETLRTQRNWTANVTTLSGDIGTASVETDNSYHVVTSSGTDSTAILDGVTITGGYALPHSSGGGMYNDAGHPILANLIFSGNRAWYYGAGLYNSGGNPTLTNVTFTGNRTSNSDGGGFYTLDGSPALTDVTFNDNGGGGMGIFGGNPTLVNVTFSNNKHFGGGGGLSIHNSSPTLTNTTFYSNTTTGTRGGGISSFNSSPTFYHLTVFSNTAPSGGGLYVDGSGSVQVNSSIFWSNSSQVTKDAGSTATISMTYSVVQNGCPSSVTCANLITTNPNLGSLGNNDGNTQTIALLAGSSAIDVVPTGANGCGTTITTDQRYVTRPQGSGCDAGAFEAQSGDNGSIYLPLVVK